MNVCINDHMNAHLKYKNIVSVHMSVHTNIDTNIHVDAHTGSFIMIEKTL